MMKKINFVLMLLGFGFLSKAQASDISQIDNTIYAENLTASAGTTVNLSIKMKNTFEVPGFQFDLQLPKGVEVLKDGEFYQAELSLERTTATKTNYFDCALQPDGSVRIMASSTKSYTFSGNDGEVVVVPIVLADTLSDGDYPIVIKEIVISDLSSVAHKPEPFELTLTVGEIITTYDEGYELSIAPFTIANPSSAAKNSEVSLGMKTAKAVKTVEFDMFWSENTQLYKKSGSYQIFYDEDSYSPNDPDENYIEADDTDMSNGTHVSFSADDVFETEYTSIALATFRAPKSTSAGIYTIELKNIVFTDADGNVYKASPTCTYCVVGNPTNKTLVLSGHLTQELTEALADEGSIGTLDLTNVTSIDGTLTLVDGRGFIAPKDSVAVEEISYQREMTTKMGTVCLPFDVSSNSSIQFYQLSGVNNVEGKMTFTPVAVVTAGTPVVFKLLSGTEADITSTDVKISAGGTTWNTTLGGEEWTMKGTMEEFDLDPSDAKYSGSDIYYIAEDKFWYGNQTFTVAAFRGWFETEKSAQHAISFDINDAGTTQVQFVETNDGNIELIFDVLGRKLNDVVKGINIINGKKIMSK